MIHLGKGDIAFIPGLMNNYLINNYPEIETICTVSNIDKVSLETEAGEFGDLLLLSVDSSFFSVFTFPLGKGSLKHALNSESIILSEDKAKILFGDADPLGQRVSIKTFDSTRIVTVSGVVSKTREKSHLQFDAVIHHSVLKDTWWSGATYVLLKNAYQNRSLVEKVNADSQRPGLLGNGKMIYTLKLLKESYFNRDNIMPYMKTRSTLFIWVCYAVCGLIFLMASFNFVNLFVLSLQARKKEVGIKKTLGVSFKNIMKSSFAEVILYVSTAFVLSLIITSLLFTSFNSILDASVNFEYLFRGEIIFVINLIVFLLGISVVIISASQQWKVRPVSLMKNMSTSKTTFNRPFFLIQFIISATLIICAITIIQQMKFVEKEPLGFNRNIIQLKSPSKELASKLQALKQSLTQVSGINQISVCNGNPISGNAIVRYDLENGEFYTPYLFSGDEDFTKTLDLTLLDGELLSPGKEGKLVNETFVRFFNLHSPIGEKIPGTEDKIIGVVKDFTCVSFKQKIPPVIISLNQSALGMLISYSGDEVSSLLTLIQKEWNKVFPDYLFSYQIIQQDLLNKYKEERFLYEVIIASSIISMIISCFGLFALSWSVVQGRVKEIGIRKVLGATTGDILHLLTISFVKRILIAFMISAPIAWFLMTKWLDNFANKITLDAWIFLYAGCIVALIAMLTLSLQTIKAAVLNPVDELRTE